MNLPRDGVMPVIHLQTVQQAIDMAGMSEEAGARGAWLIDHQWPRADDPEALGIAFEAVRSEHPALWLGMNCLSLWPRDSILLAKTAGADGAWVDNAVDVNPNGTEMIDYDVIDEVREGICYFGGIAMKGSGYVDDPLQAARKVAENYHLVDVAVTSGPGTGHATPADRLKAIRIALGPEKKLAVASGVNAENVTVQARLANYLLAATSIETVPMSGVFDEAKLRELVEKARTNALQ